jgi:hypothetical protein
MPPLPVNRARAPGGSIPRGILLLGRGRATGMKEFGNSSDALTASLAPLIAFPLVGSVMIGIGGQPGLAAIAFLSRLCGVLVLPVITQAYARLFKRDATWLSTAAALNWSFWILIPLLLAAAFLGALLVTAGVTQPHAETIVILLLAIYMLWLHWFIARTGLQLSGWAAAGLVILSNIAIGILTFGPDLVDFAIRKQPLF